MAMTGESEGLSPCPFCAAAGYTWAAFPQFPLPWRVDFDHAEGCPIRLWDGMVYATRDEARASWNTRPSTGASAREILAAEYERIGNSRVAEHLRSSQRDYPSGYEQSVRAIESALRSSGREEES